MNIFITGGTGFIGSYVIRDLLNRGYHNITATKRQSSRMELVSDVLTKVEWVECDLFNILQLDDLIKDHDAIIHIAGAVSFSPRNRKKIFKTNIEATSNLINISIERKIKRFIHFSSVAAMGLPKSIINESQVWTDNNSKSIYSLSKYLGEKEAWRGHAEGLNISIINPSFVLGGAYWDYGTMSMITKIDKGLKYYPIGTTGVVDVRDVARMCSSLLSREDMSGLRFICNAENISHLNLMTIMCELLGKNRPTTPLTGWLGEAAWRLEALRSLITGTDSLFSQEAYHIASSMLSYDNSRSRQMLDFEYIPLIQSVKETIECYKSSSAKNASFGIMSSR